MFAQGTEYDMRGRILRQKNVTILGLPRLHRGLHIVCPKDSQRYYLLFTRIHKLFALLLTTIRTLFRTSTLPNCHDSTKTRNPARLTSRTTSTDCAPKTQ